MEAVADTEHRATVIGERDDRLHDRRELGDRADAQIVAVGEAARDDDRVDPLEVGVAGVASVRQGKVFDIELADGDPTAAEATLREAAEKLLANTVIENFRVEVAAAAAQAEPAAS